MTTFPAIYIDPQGVIKYIADCPDSNAIWTDDFSYENRLQAAKDSAVIFQDQNIVKYVIENGQVTLQCLLDTIHPIPDGYSVEMREESRYEHEFIGHARHIVVKVAVLAPPTEQKESQEELWDEVEDIVSNEIEDFIEFAGLSQLTYNIKEELKKKFNINRK